jgi:hypothetical protein
MATAQSKVVARGLTEMNERWVEKKGYFMFFPVSKWVKVSEKHVGDDIYIETDKEIRNVYLNGELLKSYVKD